MGSFAAAGGGTLRNPLLWNPESARYCLSWLKSLAQHPWHFNALHTFAWFPYASYASLQASRHRKIVELLVVTSVSPGRRFRGANCCFSCSLPLQRKTCFFNDSGTLPKKLLSSWHVLAQFSRWLRKLIDKNKLHSIRNCLPPTFYGSSFRILSHMSHPFCGPSFRFANSASWVVPARTRSKEFLHSCGRRADGNFDEQTKSSETMLREDNS